MIRQLTEKDREAVLAFVGDRSAENLFIIGDIEAFGFESDTVTVWGDFDEVGSLTSILLRYRENFIPYARDIEKLDGKAWGDVISQAGQLKMISGLKRMVGKVLPFVHASQREKKLCFYAKREDGLPLNRDVARRDVKMAFPEEADKIVQLTSGIDEFSSVEKDPAVLQKNMEKGISRTYYIEQKDEPVSVVSTTAETHGAAMIVGVCTQKDYRHQGLATACMIKMIAALKAEHKQPCLFYDNPAAGKIYKRLGFVDIGEWVMVNY
ncbi:GNAT family N-acetyltransferase [Sporolactobacillus pectinivorans]|uniref:GNAT family N-acetyltransferase n=1 Tax=Sporolactobacillus pectinivorans TaxID=1591408 RepID=UPI000C26B5B7|nr:GNAT family N-acetyltransferase [Sporolactobacillus pectinivorans]